MVHSLCALSHTINMTRDRFQALQVAFLESNEATAHIEHRNYETAISLLTKVLRDCQRFIRESARADDFDESLGYRTNAFLDLDRCMKYTGNQPEEEKVCGGAKQEALDDGELRAPQGNVVDYQHFEFHFSNNHDFRRSRSFYMYKRPIKLPDYFFKEEETLRRCPMSSVFVFLTSVLSFNLALTHHLSAYDIKSQPEAASPQIHEDKSVRQKLLLKAIRLYEICGTLQDERDLSDTSLYDLATANNLGVIRMQLSETEKAKECFQFALSVTMLLLNKYTGRYDVDGGHGICQCDIDGFLQNAASALWTTTLRVAPAA